MGDNKAKIDNILQLSNYERYYYFIRKVADFEEVWGLYNDGWAVLGDKQGLEVVPFWPEKEFADLCVGDQWKKYSPKSISIEDFMEKWLPGMEGDGRQISVFYKNISNGLIKSPKEVSDDLEAELKNLR